MLWVGLGCESPPHRPAKSPAGSLPLTVQQFQRYPELASRRFATINDFESPDQSMHFQVPGGAAPQISSGYSATGAGSLQVVLSPEAPMLSGRMRFVSDWARYSLLLMAVHAPRPIEAVTLKITQKDSDRVYSRGDLSLQQGWNVLRMDLAAIEDQIDLARVGQMQLILPGLDGPAMLFLDDLLLADNRRDLTGGQAGALFVRVEGLRYRIGAARQWEIVAGGSPDHGHRIIGWYDAFRDPQRRNNLLEGLGPRTTLGPQPIVLALDPVNQDQAQEGQPKPLDFSLWGDKIHSSVDLLEVTPVRCRLRIEWRFYSGRKSPDIDQYPAIRWDYVIYPSGQLYTTVTMQPRSATVRISDWALAVCADGERFKPAAFPELLGRPERPEEDFPTVALVGRAAGPTPTLALHLHDWQMRDGDRNQRTDGPSAQAMIRLGPLPPGESVWRTLLVIDPEGAATLGEYLPAARQFARPTPPQIHYGSLDRTSAGDDDRDGFNQAEGCFVLRATEGVVRLTFDGRSQPLSYPVVKVHHLPAGNVWAFAAGQIVAPLARLAADTVLFQLPLRITTTATVELTAAEPASE